MKKEKVKEKALIDYEELVKGRCTKYGKQSNKPSDPQFPDNQNDNKNKNRIKMNMIK